MLSRRQLQGFVRPPADLPPNLRQFLHTQDCQHQDKHTAKKEYEGENSVFEEAWVPIVRHIYWLAMDDMLERCQTEAEEAQRRKRREQRTGGEICLRSKVQYYADSELHSRDDSDKFKGLSLDKGSGLKMNIVRTRKPRQK